ncbi:MAG: HAMP domain-containing sensor histidine kinase, partial [Bacteroidota bacterium]
QKAQIQQKQEETQAINDQLYQANEEILSQKEEITIQNEQLHDLNAVKDRVFSIIAHDLRGPIITLLSLLKVFKEDEELDQAEIKQYMERVFRNVVGVADLLNNLLYWARSQMQGALIISPQALALSDYLHEIVNLFAETAREKAIQTSIDSEDKLPKALVDPDILRFLLRNLLQNAYKFSNVKGKVSVKVNTTDKPQLKITVQDEGIGMEEAQQKALFKGFVNSRTGTGSEKGTGLGLMLCQEFVEQSGGSIGVESEVGKGSAFWITLPMAE